MKKNDTYIINFKASNLEANFISMVWIGVMFFPLFSSDDSMITLFSKLITIIVTGVFIYLICILLNIIKYSIASFILKKITKKDLFMAMNRLSTRFLFLIAVFLFNFIILLSFFHLNLFEEYKIISGNAKDWIFLSFGILMAHFIGVLKFIVEIIKVPITKELTLKEKDAIQNAINEHKDNTVYFD